MIKPYLRAPALVRTWVVSSSLFLAGTVNAQQFSIAAGAIDACAGVLEDTGGPSGQYGNNENHTVVICPTNPGDGISLQWAVFNLSTAGAPNTWDQVSIWDGNSTGATFLGSYTGIQLSGLTVSATTFNPTGCLTVRFTSNNAGTGDFAASISCITPCDRPTAVAVMSEAVPALVCEGEVISFDGSGSFAAPGFNITSYEWVFDDGTTANGPTSSHSFSIPGEYIVQLNLIDDNNCVNSNVVDLQVLVSTTPVFNGTIESLETCLGASVDLTAVVAPVTWTGIPEANFGGGVYLPDDVGIPFTSDLDFTQFNPGQLVTGTSDILSMCVSMEHSFLGDLVLSVTCPNGQNIIFHQQGGGGTYIGGANDGDSNANPVPGTCWDYCWSPTATWGTWVQSSTGGTTPNVMQGGTPSNNSLIPGTYTSLQPFTNLIGCPLNGTWTFTSLDLWGADNGFLCNWSINFNPAIIPAVTQFTPDLGTTTPDSAYWAGPDLVLDPNNPLNATAALTAPGTYPYSFFIIDNFGCTYDTTITVTILPQMVIDAGPDIVLCSNPLPMAGAVVANGPPTNCVWVLQLNESFGDTWNGGANLAVTIGGVTTNYAITTSGTTVLTFNLNVATGASIVLQFTAGTIWNNENSFRLFDDLGALVYQSPQGPPTGVAWSGTISCGGGSSPTVWTWTPVGGLTNPADPLTNVYVSQPTWFYLTAYPVGSPECAVLDSVLVTPDPSINAGTNNVLIVCAGEPVFLMTDSLGGTPDAGGTWTTSGGVVVPNAFDPNTGVADLYTYTVTSAASCVATANLDITIIPADDPTCCGIADAGPPRVSCNLTNLLTATRGNTGVGLWSGPAGAVFADALDDSTTVTMPAGTGGTHQFYWTEDDGAFCYLRDSVLMTFTDTILVSFTHTEAICYSYCDGTAQATVTGGNIATNFQFDWSSGDQGPGVDQVAGLCAGSYILDITDDNGCLGSNAVVIGQPVLLQIDSLSKVPVTCSGDCDGVIIIHDAEAVDYSFDDGVTWAAANTIADGCERLYPLRIRDAAGCIGTQYTTVIGPPLVVADFEWNPIPANVNDPRIWFANTSAGAQSFVWDIAGLMTTSEVSPVFRFSEKEPGSYDVCMVASNYNDCMDSICKTVTIEDVLFVYVPNSFTPDGDGLNETWGLSANIPAMTRFQLRIFDRWGQVIFETEDPSEHWDGGSQKTDVYVYHMEYEIANTEVAKELFGTVTLMK